MAGIPMLLALIGVVAVIVLVIALVVMLAKRKSVDPYGISGAPPGPAPGWYPNPHDPNSLRYFDGQVWTSSTQPRS
jgi:hypothetical protein